MLKIHPHQPEENPTFADLESHNKHRLTAALSDMPIIHADKTTNELVGVTAST